MRHLDPALFPSDRTLIDAQARIVPVDEIVAGLVRASGASIQHVFLSLYIATLLLMYVGAAWIGARLYRGAWTPFALAAALTLRHAIAKTGVNTLEAYFHPRELAFALGLIAVAAFLDRRWLVVIALLAFGVLLHPTTAVFFAAWLAIAAWARAPRHRTSIGVGA